MSLSGSASAPSVTTHLPKVKPSKLALQTPNHSGPSPNIYGVIKLRSNLERFRKNSVEKLSTRQHLAIDQKKKANYRGVNRGQSDQRFLIRLYITNLPFIFGRCSQ